MLKELLNEHLKKAMREKQSKRLSVIRMLIAELTNEEKAAGQKRGEEEVCRGYHKKLLKALELYPENRKPELMEEIKIVEEFLPKLMSREEITAFIKANLKDADVNMKNVMPLLKGKADPTLIKEIVTGWGR
jgi:uncharacterized protein